MADNLRGLKSKLGLGPCHLVAHGDAAVTALHTAVLYPEMVAGLVLTEPRLPEPRNGIAPSSRSALTTRRILLIEQPVVALFSPGSSAQALCRFLEDQLPHCKAGSIPEDPERIVAQIRTFVSEMAGVLHEANAIGSAKAPHRGMSGPRSNSWPAAGDGSAIARWVTRLSAWRL
jgi:pimeloyl-ACP methyl ester carboxylesterase